MGLSARAMLAMCLAACAPRTPAVDIPERLAEPRTHPLAGYERHFHLTWNGARMGDAVEQLRPVDEPVDDAGGPGAERLRFTRHERVLVRRGSALIQAETGIVIDTDAALRARRIELRQRTAGVLVRGEARRDRRGDWTVRVDGEPPRTIPGHAVPAELVPLLLAGDRLPGPRSGPRPGRRFEATVILPGYGFATARLHVVARGPRAYVALLDTGKGILRGDYTLDAGGLVTRVRAADGGGAVRVAPAAVAATFDPPEIVDASAIPLDSGPAPGPATRPATGPVTGSQVGLDLDAGEPGAVVTLWIAPVSRPAPPPLPGQVVETGPGGWRVTLRPGDAAGRAPLAHATPGATAPPLPTAERTPGGAAGPRDAAAPDVSALADAPELAALARRITDGAGTPRQRVEALVSATAELLAGDLGATATTARAALALGRGDCTAHAALFAGLARASGLDTRMVTGYRLDGDRLVRHRWAIVGVDGAWMAVDPTYGEAPARARLLGLATHGLDAADMALTDDVAFAGLARARARLAP